MKRTIAAVLAALMTILCIGWGYSESDALNDGIEAEEIILDQLPEPEQESEEDMATGDKLVNLDDLKVAYDKQQEDTNSLKSALTESRLIDGLNIWTAFTAAGTDNGVTFTPIIKDGKSGYALSGTATGGIVRNINGYVYGQNAGNLYLDNVAVGEKIYISGALSNNIRVAVEAFNASNTSLGFTQDSGNGAVYTKTTDASYLRLYLIINNGTATNTEVYPSFIQKGGAVDEVKSNVQTNANRTYANLCEFTAQSKTQSGVTFTRTELNGQAAYKLSGTSTSPIFFYLVDKYIRNDLPTGSEVIVSGSFHSGIRVAVEYKDANLQNTQYKQDMGNTGLIYTTAPGMDFYKPCIIVNNGTNCNDVLIIPKVMLTDSLQYMKQISKLKLMVFGDSIMADDFAGIGTKIAEVGNMTLVKNWAHGGSTASDWYYQGEDISPVDLDFDDMYIDGKNVLANQVRAALQYTTESGQQISWYHPVVDKTFAIPTSDGVGLGHTDEKPDIIFISSCTNDGHSTYQGERTTGAVDDVSTVINQSYTQLDRSSIASGIRWAVETLQCAYPNAVIFVNAPFQAGYDDASSDPVAFSYSAGDTKRQIIEKISRFCSTHYIDSFSESGYSFFVAKNGGGLHPNGINRYNIARFLLNEINNRYTERKKWY